jgi:hypothetical protein
MAEAASCGGFAMTGARIALHISRFRQSEVPTCGTYRCVYRVRCVVEPCRPRACGAFRINLPICMNIVHLLRRSFVEALPRIHLAGRFVHVVRSANGTNWICGSFVPANAPRNR